MEERWSLMGRTALVTGATKGIGKAIAEELARLGASVYVCARSEEEVNERLVEWKEAGLTISGCHSDVSSYESCEQLMAQVFKHFQGKLHILVLNAGRAGVLVPFLDVPVEDMMLTLRTNLESNIHLSRLAHPLLKASGGGSIVFNSSLGGSQALGQMLCIYNCTKGALNQLAKSLALEWAKDGIRVNAVAPGYTQTDMIRPLGDEGINLIKTRVPMRRVGDVNEIAAAVDFLCMPCSSFTTGSIVTIDGGMSCHVSFTPCPSIETS